MSHVVVSYCIVLTAAHTSRDSVAFMVQSQSHNIANRARGSSRVFVIVILAIATTCLILSQSITLKPLHSLFHGSLLGDPFEPDSQDEQPINQPDHSERLQSYVYGLAGESDGSGSTVSSGTSMDARQDTDDVRHLRRSGDYAQGGDRHVRDDGRRSDRSYKDGPGASTFVRNTLAPSENYNVNIINGQGSDVSSPLSYITSPAAGFGSDLVGGDITSSLNHNIRDIQKLQQQFSAPERARRRSKLAQLHTDDKMLQSRLLDTLKLQESQMIAETDAVKRLSLSLQHTRQRQQQELDQRATTSQLNELRFDLKRLAAMQKAEYKSMLQTKAKPGPPGLPGPRGPPGANGHNGLNGSPGSIQQLIPVRRHRLAAAPQTHWVSPDGQRSWDIHPPIPPPHRRCQDDDLSCNSQNNPNTWGSARKESDAEVRRHRLAAVPSGHWADEALFRHNSPAIGSSGLSFLPPSLPPAIPPPYVPFPNRIETLPNGAKCVVPICARVGFLRVSPTHLQVPDALGQPRRAAFVGHPPSYSPAPPPLPRRRFKLQQSEQP
jgi:hypothetical protein